MLDPQLELYDGTGALLERNDNYKDGPDVEAIAAANLTPTDDRESAISRTLPPGPYTAVLRGADDTTGIGLVEAYDVAAANGSKVVNLSTRAFVSSGDRVLIGGLILQGINRGRLLFRAIGPRLESAGITNTVPDPTLRLIDGDGTQIASNDDWREAANAAEIEATGLPPQNDREPAIFTSLSPGNYTVIVEAKGGTTGNALVESYQLD